MTSQNSSKRESGPQQSASNRSLGRYSSREDDNRITRLATNLKELFRTSPRGGARSSLLIDEHTGFGGFLANLHELFAKPELAGIPASAHGFVLSPVRPRRSDEVQFTRVQALSLSMHVLALALIITPLLPALNTLPTSRTHVPFVSISISPSLLAKLLHGPNPSSGSGASGEHDPVPPTVGQAPPFEWRQLAPPILHPIENPKLPVPTNLVGPPELKIVSPNLPNWGDPNQHALSDSGGQGGGGGIGTDQGHGIGIGKNDGFGPGDNDSGVGGTGIPGGINGYGFPSCVYCPHAEFTDEAVKAKVQGAVIITAIIGIDGRATDIYVSQGLGFGLDEKAKEAVRNWRFKPALGPGGKPTPVRVPIEVDFHLY
jgi:periplasmic protein TonB